jgi:hypothetical protein
MPANFTLTFKYTIKYVQSDVLYFGLNLLLGCREFPLRFAGSATASGGADISPKSTRTFNFAAINQPVTFTDSTIFDPTGASEITRQMLFSDPSNSDQWTFRIGSVALKQVIEVNPSGNINDFFNDQYIEISDADLTITIEGDSPFRLQAAKSSTVKLGKQHGEILIFAWP